MIYGSNSMENSAANHVMRLPELLELILLHLPQKDLLLCQRVSSSFRHTIQGSVRCQRALFFAPDWNLAGRRFDAYSTFNRPGPKPQNNSLLLRAFPGCYPTITLVIVNDSPTPMEAAIGRRSSEHWSWDVCTSNSRDIDAYISTDVTGAVRLRSSSSRWACLF